MRTLERMMDEMLMMVGETRPVSDDGGLESDVEWILKRTNDLLICVCSYTSVSRHLSRGSHLYPSQASTVCIDRQALFTGVRTRTSSSVCV